MARFKVEEGIRAMVDGKSGEVVGEYQDGYRFRYDDGTTAVVSGSDIGKYEEPEAPQPQPDNESVDFEGFVEEESAAETTE